MSLLIPDAYRVYRLIAIDPGINFTGISLYEIDTSTGQILSVAAATIITDRLPDFTELDQELYSEHTVKLGKLKYHLKSVFGHLHPQAVACESPFYSRLRPLAYGSLLVTMSTIQAAVIETNPNIYFKPIEPLLVKKIIGAGAKLGKLDVKLHVSRTPAIMQVLTNDLDDLDEHSIDAIAIGYAFLHLSGVQYPCLQQH